MEQPLKVPKDQFEAVIRALLNTPPLPLSDIPRKRDTRAEKRDPYKGTGRVKKGRGGNSKRG